MMNGADNQPIKEINLFPQQQNLRNINVNTKSIILLKPQQTTFRAYNEDEVTRFQAFKREDHIGVVTPNTANFENTTTFRVK